MGLLILSIVVQSNFRQRARGQKSKGLLKNPRKLAHNPKTKMAVDDAGEKAEARRGTTIPWIAVPGTAA
jgi:hypothetical protein